MADISKEIQAFRDARKGKEVRGSMISLAEKVNADGEQALADVAEAILVTNKAVAAASEATQNAKDATETTVNAAANADEVREATELLRNELEGKRDSDYWRGQQGLQGVQGPQGESGVMAPSSGMFSLFLDPATGNLYADYPDGSAPPAFEYDAATGELYYVTG